MTSSISEDLMKTNHQIKMPKCMDMYRQSTDTIDNIYIYTSLKSQSRTRYNVVLTTQVPPILTKCMQFYA